MKPNLPPLPADVRALLTEGAHLAPEADAKERARARLAALFTPIGPPDGSGGEGSGGDGSGGDGSGGSAGSGSTGSGGALSSGGAAGGNAGAGAGAAGAASTTATVAATGGVMTSAVVKIGGAVALVLGVTSASLVPSPRHTVTRDAPVATSPAIAPAAGASAASARAMTGATDAAVAPSAAAPLAAVAPTVAVVDVRVLPSAPPPPRREGAAPAAIAPRVAETSRGRSDAPRTPSPTDDDALVAEKRLIDGARTALRARNLTDARAVLARHAASFPDGQLAAEREALTIGLLRAEGRIDEASARASREGARFPADSRTTTPE